MTPQKVKHLYIEEQKLKPDISHLYMVTEKIDGWYCTLHYDHKTLSWGYLTSRTGRVIPSLKHYTNEVFDKLPILDYDVTLIMEAYIKGKEFHELNGILNRSTRDFKAKDVKFSVHDCLVCKEAAISRYSRIPYIIKDVPCMTRTELLMVSDSKDLWLRTYRQVINNGGEGVILKRAGSYYQEGKRNSSLMKIKQEESFDLLCTKVYETKGKKGFSSVNIDLIRKDGTEVTVRIGKEEDQTAFINKPDLVVGKVVEIKCMRELKDGSLREPVFKAIRYNKNITEVD